MNLLDPTLAIDLQYLGVHLPIPPPRTSLEPVVQELHPAHGACSAFVSRTGKTTDVTQIKGWREKFTPAEATSTPKPPTAEGDVSAVAAGSDSQKKNLSAFCSDMLDEYLENEGRLIDERASTFSQPVVDIAPPLAYELPTKSTSYVRTLHSVMQKQTGSATSELISGFIPPSKRPKLSLKETRNFRKEPAKQRGPKHNRPKPKASSASLGQVESNIIDTHPAPAQPDPVLPEPPTLKRKKKHLKPNPTPQTVTLPQTPTTLPSTSEDMAPLDSDSELGDLNSPKSTAQKEDTAAVPPHQEGGAHGMTRALLRQKDLEDGVIWEGRHRTTVTEERASIALTSLFTLMGFVRENPTAPIQLACRRAPPCLNDFCRLGCVCSSLGYCSRISHCGRPACMLGCSCLKQKVVLLKNLDGSDSSPSHHSKKRKKKRRMKMAYVLKEADSVSQPADRVRTLWKRNDRDHDPDPVHIPKRHNMLKRAEQSSCARVRVFRGKKSRRTDEVAPNGLKSKQLQPKSRRQGDLEPETRTSASPTGKPPTPGFPNLQSVGTSPQPSSPGEPQVEAPEEPPPKPSKRLIILAECMWASDNDRNLVLKELCERMACDQLDKPFWIRQYFISPVLQTTEGSGTDCCIQYKIHISTPKPEPENSAASRETAQVVKAAADEQSVHFDDWQREIEPEEVEHLDEERHVAGDGVPEVEVGSASKCEGRAAVGRDAKKRGRGKDDQRRADMGLPFLTGISPAGFLSATRKQPGEGDHAIKVNGKLYPMAKVQLGKMGALHPANRLAAYLTGRVGSSNKRPPSLSSVLSQTLQFQSSDPAPQTIQASVENSGLTGNPPPGPKPSVKVTIPSTTTASQVITNLTQPLNQPNKASKMFMVPVLSSSGMVPMAPVPTPTSTSQKIVLYPVKSTTGVQYFRRPDGQLYRLLPMSQLRQLKLKQAGQTGALPSSHPVLVRQNVSKAPPLTSVITNLVTAASTVSSSANTFTTSSSCSSSTRTSPTSSLLGPLPSLAALLSQKNECTFKTLPAASSSLPSIKSVTCALPLDPSRLAVEQKVTPPPPPTVKTPEDASGPALHSSTQQTGSELELACNPSDLDIICVNEDTRPDDTEGGAGRAPQAGREESSSGDESTDSEGGDVGRDEATGPLRKNRLLQNTLEKLRRTKIRLLFDSLRTELGSIDDRTSKASILQKAVQEIQQLVTLESKLKKKKRRLMKKRDRLIDAVSPSGEREQLNASSEQQILEQQHAANQLPAAGGGASATPAGKQSCIPVEPFSKPHNNLQAPPPPVPTPVQALKPPPAKPGVSHNASCNNQRTVPNILSRRRKPPTPSNNDKEVEKLNNLLVQPSSTLQQQEVPANLPSPPPPAAPPPPPHILLVPPRPERSSDQSRGLGHPSETLPSCPSSKGPTLCPGPGAGEQAVEGVRGLSEEPCKDSNWESLTPSDDDVLMNQPMDTAHLQEESVHSSWLLRLDSDSDEPVTSETEEAGLDDRMQCSEHKLLPGPTNGNIINGGALVPPPLLQMRVGGATVVDTTSRPMPRLVPLGLRGTLPS
ncbi:MAX dimerization protein MGA a isoform X5 [Takifugu flavidus]|nr:MAX dimerization protein MGA a isoform X5 [Takifugu flavidus]